VHATHNMTLGDPNDTLQYFWCIEGKWKLIKRFHGNDVSQCKALHQWDQEPFHLYDLKNDPDEKDDLGKKFPQLVSKMDQMMDDWLKETSKK
jgi:arylsulfatase A-like enzyme